MKKQASIKTILSLTLLVIAGTLTARCGRASSQAVPDTRGFKEFHDRVEEYEKLHKDAEKSRRIFREFARSERRIFMVPNPPKPKSILLNASGGDPGRDGEQSGHCAVSFV